MTWRYSDYIRINQDFIDVFSAEQDEKNAQAWMSFIPHQQMLDLLRALLDSLERKAPQALWMHGQYGTGKTMCLFVLKHLLEDSWPTVEQYFEAHNVGMDLRQRVRGIRERGEGLIVYLSGSGHVDTNLKFMASLERAVQQGIELRGGRTVVGPLFESVLQKLESPAINWPALFDQHRGQFLGLAGSAQDVLDQLRAQREASQPRLELLQKVVFCLQSASVVVLDSAERMKSWLDEVIATNSLKWIVVMWDEFTEFFLRMAGFDGLQEMAQFSAKSPFYVMLSTHKPPEAFERGRMEDWRKLRDRFKLLPYRMEPVTANKLMAGVMKVSRGLEAEWKERGANLWQLVRPYMSRLLDAAGDQRLDDYADLVPLHPYAAYLLSSISQQFSSASRTVFKFMKVLDANGFPKFLNRNPQEGQLWYTAEGLWDYFFGQYDPDMPSEFRDGISYYTSRKAEVKDPNELRALKATMLLISLEKVLVGAERIKPSLANLGMMFAGTSLQEQLPQLMEALTKADLVFRVGSATGERAYYTIPHTTIDHEHLHKLRSTLPRFGELVKGDGVVGVGARAAIEGSLPERLRRRLALTVTSTAELQSRRERVVAATKPYEIAVVLVVSENDEEVLAARELVQKLSAQQGETLWIVLDDSFGAQRFAQHQEDAAFARYYAASKDDRDARLYEDRCRGTVSGWLQSLRDARLTSWLAERAIQVSGVAGFQGALEDVVKARFPFRPELILATDPLFKNSGYGLSGAQVGLGLASKGVPYDQVLSALAGLVTGNEPLDADKLRLQPDHPVTRMQLAVNELLSRDSVALDDVWELLQAPPFGLPPSPIAIALFGLLLRECGSGFYYSDGVTSHSLDLTKLAQLIKEAMDGRVGKVLQRSSQEERRFCALVGEVFQLEAAVTTYLLPTRDALRGHLVRRGFPFWSLKHQLRLKERPDCEGIDALNALISSTDVEAYGTQERLRALVTMLSQNKILLRELDDPTCYQSGMRFYLAQVDTRLEPMLAGAGLSVRDLMARIRSLLEEEVWLWSEEEVAERLPALLDDLELVGALAELTNVAVKDLEGAAAATRAMIKPGKLPMFVLAQQDGESLAAVMDSLDQLLSLGSGYADKAVLAGAVRANMADIRTAISQPARSLRHWAANVMNVALSEGEADQLWSALPDLSAAKRADEIRYEVRQRLRAMERSRAIAQLRETWRKMTGTASPDEWSNRHQAPLGWLLESAAQTQALAVVQRPANATLEAIQEAQATLGKIAPDLDALGDGEADRKFVDIVAGAYSRLIPDDDELARLRAHLGVALGGAPAGWQRAAASEATRAWIRLQYRERYLPRVLKQLEATPEAAAKALLAEMATDPLVGVRLLGLGKHDAE
jgi:hypothetical protein